MYNKGKYVVGEIGLGNGSSNLGAIVISEAFAHGDLRKMFIPGSIVGAGFFDIDHEGRVRVYDRSAGLGVGSRPEDARHVARAVGLSNVHTYP